MSISFRLFSLPFVPLKQVLDNVGPEVLIILSMCSLKSKSIVVSYRGPSKNVQLKLQFGSLNCLEDSNESNTNVLLRVEDSRKLPMDHTTLETVKFGSFGRVPVRMEILYLRGDKQGLIMYWEDPVTGVAAIGDYGREIFNRDISEVRLVEKQANNDNSKYKPKIDEELNFILENFKCTKKLFVYVEPSEHFRPAKLPNFRIDTLRVYYSFWIKQKDLLAMDCKTVTLCGSKLTNQDFNVFLKHWMSGGCSQLKNFYVIIQEPIDYDIVFDGVEFIKREEDVERVFVGEDGYDFTISGGYDLKRSNVMATITSQSPSHFWMIVW